MSVTDVDEYPQVRARRRDEQKVEYVYNRDIDTAHSNPGGVFGYRGVNDRWRYSATCYWHRLFPADADYLV